MDNEISEETQAAILLAQFRRARERLHHDGALSTPAVRRRVLALAAEWSIPPADYARLMHKRVSTGAMLDFCEKHDVNLDWLLGGDLKGLHPMRLDRKERGRGRPAKVKQMMEKCHRLPPEQQRIIEATVDRLLEQQP
jgi:hypothetical protein